MSHEGGPEGTQQRTVAELLAMYGAEPPENAPRRRRRRDDPSDTGAYSIVDRVNSESSSRLTPVRDDQQPPPRNSHRSRHHQPSSQQLPAVDPRSLPPRQQTPPP
ncbi:MAG TPA: hypothetical protein VFT95_02725, partial [Micromonosporaceae bacterium]|nr:hypothetical protein [Micromonosporaceae bacterium]